MSIGILLFALSILLVVTIHELGHFSVAKFYGFKATKFFVGFGPRVWSTKRGETEYGIGLIPAGGYVKIIGMNPYEEIDPADEPRSYPNKPIYQRAILLAAGSATHFIVAFVILVLTAMLIGFPTGGATNKVAAVETELRTETGELVARGTPASEAGIRPGDQIVAIDGDETPTWSSVRNAIRANPGEVTEFTLEDDDGERRTVSVPLATAFIDADQRVVEFCPNAESSPACLTDVEGVVDEVGFFGVQPEPEFIKDGPIAALGTGAALTWDVTKLSFRGIGDVFTMVFGGELWDALQGEGQREIDEGPLGLVGAGRIASQTVERGQFLDFIGLVVGFTIFVGLMNLLPLPPLDGGHLAVLAYEKVTGRRVDIRKLIPVAAAVISFFVILFVAVLYLDLARPIRVPF